MSVGQTERADFVTVGATLINITGNSIAGIVGDGGTGTDYRGLGSPLVTITVGITTIPGAGTLFYLAASLTTISTVDSTFSSGSATTIGNTIAEVLLRR